MKNKKIVSLFMLIFILFISANVSAAGKFHDLHNFKWAENDIYFLHNKGIINGYGDGKFGPNDKITRGQAALMLVNALYPNAVPTEKNSFSDLHSNSYYYDAVLIAKEKGLINGYSDGTFKGNSFITRAETAVMIDNAYQITRGSHKVSFSDVPKNWYIDSVLDLASQKIISGYSDGTFRPAKYISRAEFSVILASAIRYQTESAKEEQVKEEQPVVEKESPQDQKIKEFVEKVIALTNEEREKDGLQPLQEDPLLSSVAQLKSEDMRVNKYFDHISPTFGTPFEMMELYGVRYCSAGENIAYGFTSPEAVVRGWMNSPGHRANILNASFTHIGVGFEPNGNYWTQMFIKK